ncbi:MAG: FAD:protein FMN transferase [Candidatus Eisenbacteria bacterium]|nr:FAD:protein FMN transferase [Candidatus Eisenbacteria bacterium]
MTQYHAERKFNLSGAPRHTKVLITVFNMVIVVALIVGVINYWDKTGMTPAGVRAWYNGNEGEMLPDAGVMTFEKTFRELLDAVHPHLFGQGVLLFILSHIVALTALSERRKIALYLFSFAAMLLDAAMPWLIRYVSPGLAPLSIVSILALTFAFLLQVMLPIRDMWFTRHPPTRKSARATTGTLALVLAGMALANTAQAGPATEHRRLWLIMGTTCEVRLRIADSHLARRGFDTAYRELALVDSLMSLYRPSSELVRLNQTAVDSMVRLSGPTWDVFAASLTMARESDGAFDITVKPLMDLWGFYRRAGHRPTPTQVDSVRSLVGWQRLVVDMERRGVRYGAAGMALDFGGIAKGYALDRAMAAVESIGIEDALIDLGGNIIARGSAEPGTCGWPVAIRDPAQPDSIRSVLRLTNEAVASSGGYEKFVVLDGITYGHIMDPRRGEPVTGVLGTTVLAPGAMLADALSTTLFVLGSRAIEWLARNHPGVDAMVTIPDGAGSKSFYSGASRLAPQIDSSERDLIIDSGASPQRGP